MTPVTRIGRCHVCLRSPRRVESISGICHDCITTRGRRWCAMAVQVREDPRFRATVRAELKTDGGRRLFDAMFGPPSLREVGE
jgi:hypothetical protein